MSRGIKISPIVREYAVTGTDNQIKKSNGGEGMTRINLHIWVMTAAVSAFFIGALAFSAYGQAGKPAGKRAEVKKAAPVVRDSDEGESPDEEKSTAPAKAEKKSKDSGEDIEKKEKERRFENEKKKIEWMERTLKYGINKDRREAIGLMISVRDKSFSSKMEAMLVAALKGERDPEVKVKAITVAGDLKFAGALPEIQSCLDDESEDVRIASVNGIKALKAVSSKDRLIEKLKKQDLSKDSNYTEALLDALGEFKAVELREFAQKAASDTKTTANLRLAIVMFLGKAGARESKEFLTRLMADETEDKELRAYAVNSLARLGIREAVKDIETMLNQIESYPFKKRKDYYNLYMYGVAALVKLGDDRAFPRLMDTLKSDSSAARLKAIRLIKDLKDKRTIDILKYKRDYDPSPAVQKAARDALSEMGVDSGKSSEKTGKKE